MSAKEPYDYVSTATADYDYTLTLKAQGKVIEEGYKNQVIHRADDNSRTTVTLAGSTFFLNYNVNQLAESESGSVFELYHDAAKANGIAKTFKLAAHDGHTYVVWFDCKFTRDGNAVSRWGIPGLRFEIKGKIAVIDVLATTKALTLTENAANVALSVNVYAGTDALAVIEYPSSGRRY